MLCRRNAEIPGSSVLKVEHHWLRTSSREAGMGPASGAVPGEAGSDCPFTPTMVNDHTGRGAMPGSICTPLANVSEPCVNEALELGRETGRWTPLNQCQSFVDAIVQQCTIPPDEDTPAWHGASGAD
jgi:hypothetical protein